MTIEKIDEANNEITVSFGCKYVEDPDLTITEAYIAGAFYEVNKVNDKYQAVIKFTDNQTKLELKLIAVKFSNGRILKQPDYSDSNIKQEDGKTEPELAADKTDSAFAFLTQPTISEQNTEFVGDSTEKEINVHFKLKDLDNTITEMKVQVMKGDDKVTTTDYEKDIQKPELDDSGEADVNFTIDKKYTEAGIYTIKVLFTYDRHDGKTHIDETFENSVLTAKLNNWAEIIEDDRKGDQHYIERVADAKTKIPIIYTIIDIRKS